MPKRRQKRSGFFSCPAEPFEQFRRIPATDKEVRLLRRLGFELALDQDGDYTINRDALAVVVGQRIFGGLE